tara:strand:- start:4155 stop:4796 length:642 start_codon:yes stop_codon:yes gene_type:complete
MEDTTSAVPINSMTDDEIRQELAENGVTLHHKSGTKKLASTLADVRTKEYKEDSKNGKLETTGKVKHRSLSGSTPESRAAKEKHITSINTLTAEQAAMKLVRVVVTPNDPLMVNYPGLIFTVGMSGINNGRMIKKFVPFSNEEGWHVPTIILRQIESAEMQKFKTVTRPNGDKVLEPYLTKKFNVQILPDLTNAEIKRLADQQAAAGFNVGVN